MVVHRVDQCTGNKKRYKIAQYREQAEDRVKAEPDLCAGNDELRIQQSCDSLNRLNGGIP